MTLSSTIGSLPYAALSDTVNAPAFGSALTAALDLVTVATFASAAAVATAIPSPTNGQIVYRSDVGLGCLFKYSSVAARWIPLDCLLAESTLSTSASSVAFTSIPAFHSHLRIIASTRCDNTGSSFLTATFNTAASVCETQVAYGHGSTLTLTQHAANTVTYPGWVAGTNEGSSVHGVMDMTVYNYSDATQYATMRAEAGTGTQADMTMHSGFAEYKSSAAISTVTIATTGGGNLVAGSKISLYGLS